MENTSLFLGYTVLYTEDAAEMLVEIRVQEGKHWKV